MSAAAPRKRALLVEDDAAIRELVRFHLDLSGYDVDEARDGRQALAQARAARSI
jgi:DNA-binding response OmpR family regulator